MASTTRVSAAARRRRAGNLLQASVADSMGFSNHATIVAHRNDRNSPTADLGPNALREGLRRGVDRPPGAVCDGELVNLVDVFFCAAPSPRTLQGKLAPKA